MATFASNIYRVQQIIDLAIESGRKVAVSGRSMVNNTEMARELGYLHAPDNVLIAHRGDQQVPAGKGRAHYHRQPGRAAVRAVPHGVRPATVRSSVGANDFIIISARPIPGNEKTVTKVVNGLLALGAEVIYENMYDVHVSGHACQEEQKLMLTLAHPQYFLPVHGEFKQLKRSTPRRPSTWAISRSRTFISPRTARTSACLPTA